MLLQGDINDHESLVKAIKQVDVVISAAGNMQLADQDKIISAIKEAGNVKVGLSLSLILKLDLVLVSILPCFSCFIVILFYEQSQYFVSMNSLAFICFYSLTR